MRRSMVCIASSIAVTLGLAGSPLRAEDDLAIVLACAKLPFGGLRELATDRTERFLGKVSETQALCWGGEKAVAQMKAPWVDWSNYWAAGNASTRSDRLETGGHILDRNRRGIDGALINLEYQRMELIRFNLFDNKTFEQYATGDGRVANGSVLKTWKEMRLPATDPAFRELDVDADGSQLCKGGLIRHRTLTGICNDIRNPAMGSSGQLFTRNVEFESTFPDLERDPIAKNRHGGRIGLLKPDPQVISRKLFTRDQSSAPRCNEGHGVAGTDDSDCAYKKAPFFNVLAAFWIQFMTHDWFSHMEDARNDQSQLLPSLGCTTQRVNNVEQPLSAEEARKLGCRPEDKMEAGLVADDGAPETFQANGRDRLKRSHKTTRNSVTAWWDASQIYGHDARSLGRVRRDPSDSAKLEMQPVRGSGGSERFGYLPPFKPACPANAASEACDQIQREWAGQEAVAFPDNWSIGLSFLHNLFVREHNIIVDTFRDVARRTPDVDSGLRNPARPAQAITYGRISNDELFEIARLIVSAEIAKIHTIEWTPQLLYGEPLNVGMNSNWSGLFEDSPAISKVIERIVQKLAESPDGKEANQLYSAFAAGPGIVGRGSRRPDLLGRDRWDLSNPDHVNGGINHFGSPFNFPEEFVAVYRLHPLVPDMIEFRRIENDPNAIARRIPVIDTFRGKATAQMREGGLTNWALSMGRQRLGLLTLRNHPQFLQNIDLRPRIDSKIDVAALDLIRDRERGVPRFNEFRRQIGLKQLTSFDDFIDRRPSATPEDLAEQRELVSVLREVYGQHRCNASLVITTAQLDADGRPINDCLGHPDGSMVDNVEDVDIVVGFLAESTRPHGYAISETQFHIFIINASRRLFSDRFFTSSFRPEFYTKLGIDWVMNNGPTGVQMEQGEPNGHKQQVSPLKRVLLRAMPELEPELKTVVNAFDPWARDRGEYYALDWRPRPGAESDPAFRQ